MDTSLKFLKKHSSLFLLLFFGVIFTSLFASQFVLSAQEPWDFKTYYFAAKTFLAGGNPYAVSAAARLPYFYHPYTFFFFLPLTRLGFVEASGVFFYLNLGLILFLLWLWSGVFEGRVKIFLILFLLFFSFNQALAVIFRSGNIALVEAALLWSAFYFLIKEKPGWFSLFIFLASLFKIWPLAFLPLLWLLPGERKKNLARLIAGLAGLWLLPFLFRPQLFWQYLSQLLRLPQEIAWVNPCSYSLLVDLLGGWGRLAYLFWVATVLYFFWRGLKRLSWPKNKLDIICFSLLTFIVVAPRFKDYSFVLATPIAHELIVKNIQLVFLPFLGLFDFALKSNYFIYAYHPFLAVLLFWLYSVYSIIKKRSTGQQIND